MVRPVTPGQRRVRKPVAPAGATECAQSCTSQVNPAGVVLGGASSYAPAAAKPAPFVGQPLVPP